MNQKRPLAEKQLKHYADLINLESDEIFGEDENGVAVFIPSASSREYTDDEVVSKAVDNHHDVFQVTTSNTNNNLWT